MGSEKVVEFPKPEISAEEKARRVMAEAERLSHQSEVEWRFWLDGSAELLGIPAPKLAELVKAKIKEREKAKAEAQRQEKRFEKKRTEVQREEKRKWLEQEREQERISKEAKRQERERQKAFAALIKLPGAEHEARLAELAKRQGEELGLLRDQFKIFADAEDAIRKTGHIEPWHEPVKTGALLQEIIAKIYKYVVLRDDQAVAVALYTTMTWIHPIATHSPILAPMSVEPDSGKSTLMNVLRFLVFKPFACVEPTGPSDYRTVDRDHPTLVIDEADDLFQRKSDVRAIVNASWTPGTRIRRQGHDYDPFCPKIVGVLGTTKLPRSTASRCIIIRMWPKKPDEKVDDFEFADDDEFFTLRRKQVRWIADHINTIKELKPLKSPGFNNRLAANWRLLFQIAQHAGGEWLKRARQAAAKLSHKRRQPSEGLRLLEALCPTICNYIISGRKVIPSAEIVRQLNSDEDGEWREFRGRGPITTRQVSLLLAEYDIYPDTVHPTGRSTSSPRGYKGDDFVPMFERFLPDNPHIRTLECRKSRKKLEK